MDKVFVTNRSNIELTIGYDGVVYEFKQNDSVELPLAGAIQLFGYTLEDREHILVRHGWIHTHAELEESLKKLDQFEITTEKPVKNSSLPSAVGVVPLRIEKSVGGKSSERRVA